eukprot:gene20446-22462_t
MDPHSICSYNLEGNAPKVYETSNMCHRTEVTLLKSRRCNLAGTSSRKFASACSSRSMGRTPSGVGDISRGIHTEAEIAKNCRRTYEESMYNAIAKAKRIGFYAKSLSLDSPGVRKREVNEGKGRQKQRSNTEGSMHCFRNEDSNVKTEQISLDLSQAKHEMQFGQEEKTFILPSFACEANLVGPLSSTSKKEQRRKERYSRHSTGTCPKISELKIFKDRDCQKEEFSLPDISAKQNNPIRY